ncbi:hypothetical protein [Nannocystis radixulma]|uniref:Poly-gamma-glutamate synthase PgsB/CapB n=1 Tax=Nannocystis radixulma TaxID=2995305 RepID=A0ABT5BPM8_9BACT|nr:hypothetical protein [Nannocystis radixulma]MDC0675663.1 hypothetical protein [Nannocystis radixulma]
MTAIIDAITEAITRPLDPLTIRLRARATAALAARLAASADVPPELRPDLFELAGLRRAPERRALVAEHALKDIVPRTCLCITVLRREHALLQSREAELVAAALAAKDPSTQQAVLAAAIRRHARGWRERQADLRALGRWLDHDALRERLAAEQALLEEQVELAVRLVGSAPAEVAYDERAEVFPCLISQLTWLPRFTLRLACLEALAAILGRLEEAGLAHELDLDLDLRLATAARGRAGDSAEHPWVQAAALALLDRVALDAPEGSRFAIPQLRVRAGARREHRGYAPTAEALELAEARLISPRGGPRDFLVRALVIDFLARRAVRGKDPIHCVDILFNAVDDASEHVRISLCAAAVQVRPIDPRGAALLTILAGDKSPKVRAAAVCGLLRGPADAPALATILADETAPLVVRVACAEIIKMSEGTWHAGPGDFVALSAVLARIATRDDHTPAVHEAAAAALQAIDSALDPARRAWTTVFAEALARTPPGKAARVSLRRPDLPPPGDAAWLGRILAALTRDDWGIDAHVRKDSILMRRGDRWAARLWRAWHELRHPSPNKRQGFSHIRGRVLRGDLRAHSGRLHEVVATEVPGERVHSEREGGWGRHLPLVDDILGLPVLRPRLVRVVSSQGTTELRWHLPLWQRLAAHLRLSLRYGQLAELRRQALDAQEPAARAAYARVLREQYGVELYFVPHPAPCASLARTAPAQLLQLFGNNEARSSEPAYTSIDIPVTTQSIKLTPEVARAVSASHTAAAPARTNLGAASAPQPAAASAVTGLGAFLVPLELPDLGEPVLADIFTLSGSSQTALAYFLAALAAMLFIGTYLRTRSIARDRARIPLVIGGWGTRGKSGTERLKAGLFHGLGYRVFAKTTGCEAMFIHAAPRGQAMEIYTFRPYGKATIWEQRTLLNLAAKTGSDVFLWECMALNPAYVEILQHHWMRDDAATITNCYPDHEDIQGPAGMDVAEVIARFVPTAARTVTSEINFLPVLRDAAGRRGSNLDAVDEFAGDLLPADLLALIPYDEHPRNVALVARLAEHLGLDRTLAIATMAEHVVPDLGVLKRYGPARVAGRTLEFINGCSANERAGFLSNWRRTGCDRLDLDKEPDRYVITVVNNREDRVARSQVFARLLVEDVAADRHLLIGTNTQGLVGYIREALEGFLAAQEIVTRDDLADGPSGRARAHQRLTRLLTRVRPVAPDALPGQLVLYAQGAGRSLAGERDEIARRCAPYLSEDSRASISLDEILAIVRNELSPWLVGLIESADVLEDSDPPECVRLASPQEAADHFLRQLARTAVCVRLKARVDAAFDAGATMPHGLVHAAVRDAYRLLFMDLIDVVVDPLTTGDQVILRCALTLPPGVRAILMGTQNIKGTGLDFVYRWTALDIAQQNLAALASAEPEVRRQALQRLAQPADPGLIDAGLVAAQLEQRVAYDGEAELQSFAAGRARALHQTRVGNLSSGPARGGRHDTWLGWLESCVEFLDGARRYYIARQVMRDLVSLRISHARAASVMRDLDSRAKGGWLIRGLRQRSGAP